MLSKHLSKLQVNSLEGKIPRVWPIMVGVVALLGFVDAMYLTIEHYIGSIPPCSIGSCEQVLTSSYASVFGLPVALFGVIYYLAIVVLIIMYIDMKRPRFLALALSGTVLGVLASLWFVIVQVFILHAYCIYCFGSVITSTTLFILAWYMLHRFGRADRVDSFNN